MKLSDACLTDNLGVEVRVHPFNCALGSVTGILDPSERSLRQGQGEAVYGHHSNFDRGADSGCRLCRSGEGVGSEAERQPIRLFYGLIKAGEGRDQRKRSEGLVVHRTSGPRDVCDDRGLEEVALIADTVAAGPDLAAL